MTEVLTAAITLSNVLLESLHHPKHADRLKPLRAKATALFQRYFKRQRGMLLAAIRPRLKRLVAEVREAEEDLGAVWEAEGDTKSKLKAKQVLPDNLLPLYTSSSMAYEYGEILTSTISGAYEQLAGELAASASITEDTMATYLRENGLRKITGNLAQTTIDRLRNAIADAYEAGAKYDGLVAVIKAEYEGFSTVRAGMIAQTELNNAYNHGRKLLGLDLRMTEKSWSCDGPDPCDICLGNQSEGWIGMDETFSSGDDMPTAHPVCYCSLDLRKGGE